MPKALASKENLTLQEHLLELRSRLFWVGLWLVLGAALGYLFKDYLISFLMAPLNGQNLVYLTPIGGFNFIFRVCVYVGIIVAVPAIVYQLYRFLEPLMQNQKRPVVLYAFFSVFLAIGGGAFAYFATMPAALNFLLDFDIQQVKAMLTVESYLSFVITYVLGFAVLFQIPLLLMIFNSIRPLPPSKLMSIQRFVVVGAFVIAAIISPTPDATNQAILAAPIIGMYNLGVAAVWTQNRASRATQKRLAKRTAKQVTAQAPAFVHPTRATISTAQPSVSASNRVITAPQKVLLRPAIPTAPIQTQTMAAPNQPLRAGRPLGMDFVPGRPHTPRPTITPTPQRRNSTLVTVRQPRVRPAQRPSSLGSIDGMRAPSIARV